MIISKFTKIVKRDGIFFTTKRVTAFLIGQTPLWKNLSFKFHNNLKLRFAPSMLTYVLFANNAARDEDSLVIERFVTPGSTCIDVGAHIGSTVLITAKKAGPTGQVIAVEASPKFFEILSENVSLNQKQNLAPIKLIASALGDTEADQVYLNESVSDDTTNHIGTTGTAVKQTTLDSLTKNLSRVDFLKIDVEGYEPEVLAGGINTLRKTKVIYIEFCSINFKHNQAVEAGLIETLSNQFNLYSFENGVLLPFHFVRGNIYALNLIGVSV
jgi:FkbM family methyltransferase